VHRAGCRSALARQLKITSLRALADADQRTVYQALRNIKPRPTLARVAEWQSHARGKLSDASDWHPAASFAVIFAQRLADSAWERRLEVERTEVEPAPAHELIPPVRLILAVSGGRPGQQVQAAVWFRRHAQPGWSPHEPVTLSPSGQAEFDLTSVPAGEHKVRLLAWATDAGSTLAAVTLPNLTVHQRTGQGQNPAVLSGHVPGQ
jgi:hypothetical protein